MTAPDDGSPDPRLAAALLAYDGSAATAGEVYAALTTARVFLPLAAHAAAARSGHAEMALLSLVGRGGRRALPAFVDGHEVQRWRAEARPVPVAGPLACRTALDDGAAALLLLPASFAVSGRALEELAAGRVPVPGTALSTRSGHVELVAGPAAAPALLAALGRALSAEPVTAARLLAGPDGPVLGVVTELPAAGLAALAARVRDRLGDQLPAAGLDLAAVAAEGPGEVVPVEVVSVEVVPVEVVPPRRRGLLRRRATAPRFRLPPSR